MVYTIAEPQNILNGKSVGNRLAKEYSNKHNSQDEAAVMIVSKYPDELFHTFLFVPE